jgi:metallophosphoesterase (TIGR00282 family)
LRILFIGDICGSSGRQIIKDRLPDILSQQAIELVIANCENAASGFGITPRLVEELLACGIDVLTSGNHIFDRKEILDYMPHQPRLLRPANYPSLAPGAGLFLGKTGAGSDFAVLNLQGRVFMPTIDCPFGAADRELARVPASTRIIVVDMHGEATSEKQAMGWYLDGKVTLVIGTHTHVPTADECILPRGTAYQTDVGMTGPHDSIIGMRKEGVMERLRTQLPVRFDVAEDDVRMNALVVEADPAVGRALSVARLCYRID